MRPRIQHAHHIARYWADRFHDWTDYWARILDVRFPPTQSRHNPRHRRTEGEPAPSWRPLFPDVDYDRIRRTINLHRDRDKESSADADRPDG